MTVSRQGKAARVNVSRTEFEEATRVLIDETLRVVDRAISSAVKLGAAKPSQVLLTGGSTRIPAITHALESHLGVPVRLNDPDTAVAKGAAIHCKALLSRSESGAPRRLLGGTSAGARILASAPVRSVVPRALGIKIHDSHDPAGKRVFVQHIVAANSPLPVQAATATFATVIDGQERVRVELMEQAGAVAGEDVEFNRRVLAGELSGLPEGLAAGSPIDFSLSVGMDGRIECVARERSSGEELVLESYMDGVADAQEADAQRHVVSGLRVSS